MDFATVKSVEIPEGEAVKIDIDELVIWRKNIWDWQWEIGSYGTENGAKINYENRVRCANLIPVTPNAVLSIKTNSSGVWLWGYGQDRSFARRLENSARVINKNIKIPSDIYFITFVNPEHSTFDNDIAIYDVSDCILDAVFSNGYYNATGFWVSNETYFGFQNPIECKSNASYRLSIPVTVSNANIYIAYFDSDGDFISRDTFRTSGTSTFNTPSNATSLALSMLLASYSGDSYNNDITMEVVG